MKTRFLFFLILTVLTVLLFACGSKAQTGVLKGKVWESKDFYGISQASIIIKSKDKVIGIIKTNDNGYFLKDSLLPGMYNLTVKANGFYDDSSKMVRIKQNSNTIENIELIDSSKVNLSFYFKSKYYNLNNGEVMGMISNKKTNKPISSACIMFKKTNLATWHCHTPSDTNGSFTSCSFEKGSYDIKINRVGYNTSIIKNIEIKQDSTTKYNCSLEETKVSFVDSVLYTLTGKPLEVTLRGTVFGKDNKAPIPFAFISLERNNNPLAYARSDFDGEYVFKNIPPGIYDLDVGSIGYFLEIKNFQIQTDSINISNLILETSDSYNNKLYRPSWREPKPSGQTYDSEEIKRMPW